MVRKIRSNFLFCFPQIFADLQMLLIRFPFALLFDLRKCTVIPDHVRECDKLCSNNLFFVFKVQCFRPPKVDIRVNQKAEATDSRGEKISRSAKICGKPLHFLYFCPMPTNWSKEFEIPSTQQWIEEIKKSVKDPKELEKLIWHTDNGFDVNAFYRKEDNAKIESSASGGKNNWEIRQVIYTDKFIAANQSALKALENGADSLYFRASTVGTEKEVNALLKNIRLDWISTHFDFEESNVAWLYLYLDYLQTNNLDPTQIKGSINFDPFSELLLTGNFQYEEKETKKVFASLMQTVQTEIPNLKVVNI